MRATSGDSASARIRAAISGPMDASFTATVTTPAPSAVAASQPSAVSARRSVR